MLDVLSHHLNCILLLHYKLNLSCKIQNKDFHAKLINPTFLLYRPVVIEILMLFSLYLGKAKLKISPCLTKHHCIMLN